MPDPFDPPAYLNSHLCPVLRVIPNSSLSSLTVNRPLCAKLINRCFCSIGNSFFQGITPSLCATHVLGQFVTDLLGSYRRGTNHGGHREHGEKTGDLHIAFYEDDRNC